MGDIVAATGRDKDGGGLSTIKCPMLTATNYTVWSMRMKITLRIHKVWEVVEADSKNGEKNDMALGLLFQSIPESLILQVGELETAKKVWEAIKTRHVGAERVKEARLQTLMTEFDRLKMKDSESIDDFGGKLSKLASKSAALGVTIEEAKLVKKFLMSLPQKKYIHIVASLEQVLDLNITSFEDILGRLKAYEERIAEEEEVNEDQSKLMYVDGQANRYQQDQTNQYQHEQANRDYNADQYRGRGRGGRFNRGRGRGRYNGGRGDYNGGRGDGGRDASRITCFRCDKIGHFAMHCLDRLLKLQEAQETDNTSTQEADELMMHEVVFFNEKNIMPEKYETNTGEEDLWYLDNGASNHMTGDKRYFSKLDDTVTGKVRFGDDSRIDIRGKGTISFVDLNGESRIMTDVYFIPELRSNIISPGQATEAGCDIRLRGELLTMHDQNNKLLITAKRSKNRLYKVRMGVKTTTCLHISTERKSSRWHARLGHVNLETIRNMMQRELVLGIPSVKLEKEVCGSCLLGKQARQTFPKATSYRASTVLELLHGDLCGPITPGTPAGKRYIFVVIDDHTRYMWSMLLREKSEAFESFKRLRSAIEQETGGKYKSSGQTWEENSCLKNSIRFVMAQAYDVTSRHRTRLNKTVSLSGETAR